MAYLSQCSVCGIGLRNNDICPECKTAKLADLLYRINEFQRNNPDKPLSPELQGEICAGDYVSLAAHVCNKQAEDLRRSLLAIKRLFHEVTKSEVMKKAGEDYERINPCPDPNG